MKYEVWKHFHVDEPKKQFVDYAHDAQGRMCRVVHNPRTKKLEFEPIDRHK